jgi:ADP-heptose:LPS heptosyltransferase
MTVADKQRVDRIFGPWLVVLLRPLAQLAGKLLGRDHSSAPRGEIVFIKLLGGGSLLIALPALLGVRRRYPNLSLTLVCGSPVAPFARLIGIFDRMEVMNDRRGAFALLASAARILCGLVLRRVDTIVDLEVYSQLTTVFSLLTLARNRIGFYVASTYWRRNVLTHLVFFNRARGVFHFYAATAQLLGAQPAPRDEVRQQLLERIGRAQAARDYVAVGGGCSDFASVRLLPMPEWREFARTRQHEISASHWIFLGAASDAQTSEEIAAAVRESVPNFSYENKCGELSLEESFVSIAGARQFIGIDSSLLHAARALAVPTLSFFGPTDPATLLEPINSSVDLVYYRPPICSPCLHVTQTPPCKGLNVCMELFTRQTVPLTPWCEDSAGKNVLPTEPM